MEETQTSAVSDEETPVTIPEKENNSEDTMDQPQTCTESADPSASQSTTEAESENQLRMFVTLLTARVLTKCHALQNRSQEEWVSHIKRLVSQTMEGLAVNQGFCPDAKSTKKVCKAVLRDLTKKFGGKRLLECVILLQDPAVDAVVVQTLQAHIKDLSDTSPFGWRDVLKLLAICAGFLAIICLILLVP